MLDLDDTFLLLIDMQDRLFRAMSGKKALLESVRKLSAGIRVFGLPIVATEQYPEGIGKTIPEVAEFLDDCKGHPKNELQLLLKQRVFGRVVLNTRNQVLVAGIEAHVCVYQTVMDLIGEGFEVQVVADAVSSRTIRNREIGLQKMRDAGVAITSVEIVLFELLRTAEAKQFREISKILK